MPALFATVLDSGWYCSAQLGLFSVKLYTTVHCTFDVYRPVYKVGAHINIRGG